MLHECDVCSAAAPAVTQEPMDAATAQLQDLQVGTGTTGDREEAPVTKAEPVGKVHMRHTLLILSACLSPTLLMDRTVRTLCGLATAHRFVYMQGNAKPKPKGLFSLRFKGLPEKKQSGSSVYGGSLTAASAERDEVEFSSVHIVPK